jgi:tRNA A-37 threonylcarbamoyl transferase component Bud32
MSTLVVNPRFALHLWRAGLRTAQDFLNWSQGATVTRHDGRSTMLVNVQGLSTYLKRQTGISWKEQLACWWAGFGLSSRCLREWQVLCELQDESPLGPEPLAAGEAAGGAFVMVRALPEAVDLATLAAHRLAARQRRLITGRIGAALAGLHERGFSHPDLFAKHVFVHLETGRVSFIDFQRSGRYAGGVPWRRRCLDLAALHASLGPEAAATSERLRFMHSYLAHANLQCAPHRRILLRWIQRRAAFLAQRPKLLRLRASALATEHPGAILAAQRIRIRPSRFTLAGALTAADHGEPE